MKLFLLALLLCSLKGVDSMVKNYTPEVTNANLAGRITATTITFQQPLCQFDSEINATPGLIFWLVVANSQRGQNTFDAITFVQPSLMTHQTASTADYYLTLRTLAERYLCPPTSSSNGEMYFVRVGQETTCRTETCNVPLNNSKSYSVKFILINPSLQNSPNVIAQTNWSSFISLKTVVEPRNIDPSPRGRSAGMIVITAILSVLLFLLLAFFVAMLLMVCCRSTGKSDISEPIPRWGSLKRYNTHNLKDTNIGPYAMKI
ncbi:uroplakin-3b-like protein 1 precursor [Callorhinchus milii]|uniref:Uroplakin 3B like 1 n=1 Tax=Callorhinchus milii TaxID=7868 RepID=K4FXR3_CALMI|nr:uroplakin-3b-like protein 1 precursor [Callorhinchus milii]AFK10512.1 uroplakin 3B-like protein [Callorhinchus milii]|eukprot:gi/632957728/ref/XP_007894644.1/ PREDICTED: uroplakin-3b-like protein [Callorhinchus milii]